MQFHDLHPGDLFTFRPYIGGRWHDRHLYRKATERSYHRADKVFMIHCIADPSTPVTPESSDAMQVPLRAAANEAQARVA